MIEHHAKVSAQYGDDVAEINSSVEFTYSPCICLSTATLAHSPKYVIQWVQNK